MYIYVCVCVYVYKLVVAACPQVVSWSPNSYHMHCVSIMIRVNVVCSNVLVVTISFDN